jgi:hypothetical protein
VRDEGDRIEVGSTGSETEVEFHARASITFEGELSITSPEVHADKLELHRQR